MNRAVRYDGLLPYVLPHSGIPQEPESIARMREWVGQRRSLEGFDIVVEGTSPGKDRAAAAEAVRPWVEAGATWWIESDWNANQAALRKRIEGGPPETPS
jgi:hypothetical protein